MSARSLVTILAAFADCARISTHDQIPADQSHLRVGGAGTKYLTDMLRLKRKGYSAVFCELSEDDCATVDGFPGHNVHTEMRWEEVVKNLEHVPALQENGTIVRLNDLGYLILNTAMWDLDEHDVKTLGLGVSLEDHKFFRPMADRLLGSRSEFWDADMIADYTEEWFKGRTVIDAGIDVSTWSTTFLHKIHLNMDITPEEAAEFYDFQGNAVIVTAMLQAFVDNPIGRWGLSVSRLQQQRRTWLAKYKAAIRADTRGIFPRADEMTDHQLHIIATGLMDSLVFAGGLSVATIVKAGMGVLFSANSPLASEQRLLTEDTVAPFVYETVRRYPGVLGFPWWDSPSIESHRTVMNLGMSLRDPRFWGEDAFEFKLRDLETYHRGIVTGFAQPANGPGWDQPGFEFLPMSRGCPGQDLSITMMTEFFSQLQKSQSDWVVSEAPSGGIEIVECVPFVDPFKISKIVKSGYLLEKSGYFGGWTRRYYQLVSGDQKFTSHLRSFDEDTYPGDDPSSARANLNLNDVIDTKIRSGESYELDGAECFKLYTSASRTDWRLCVSSSDAGQDAAAVRDEWLRAIQYEMPHMVSAA